MSERLTRLVLRLARNPEAGFPDGDDRRGYVLTAPLNNEDRLDLEAWRRLRLHCTVRRFSPDKREDADGWLTHRGAQWSFHYDEDGEGPDEPTYRLGDHRLAIGDYVTIEEFGEKPLTYRVTEAMPIAVGANN